jgi:hypothetical protein
VPSTRWGAGADIWANLISATRACRGNRMNEVNFKRIATEQLERSAESCLVDEKGLSEDSHDSADRERGFEQESVPIGRFGPTRQRRNNESSHDG